jgi:ribosome-associated protein
LTTKTLAKKASISQETLNDAIIEAIQDVKGKQIVKLDLRKIHDAPVSYFIICEGTSNTQVKAIADTVQKQLKDKLGVFPSRVEGSPGAQWILVDYFDTVVHVFYPETREFYDLEGLWDDAFVTTYHEL